MRGRSHYIQAEKLQLGDYIINLGQIIELDKSDASIFLEVIISRMGQKFVLHFGKNELIMIKSMVDMHSAKQ